MSSDISSIYYQDNINSANSTEDKVYEFEDFRLDASHLMLYRNEQPLALAPKVIETLVALVERSGEVVSKEEMMNRLWADSFVEESNLTQNIYLLRKTLGKNASGKNLIETFRRRGYRFTGDIKAASRQEIPENTTTAAAAENDSGANNQATKRFDSLAVLPLTNEGSDETAEYLSDGITESIINRLSQLEDFRVVARNTVFRYKNQTIEPQALWRELGVKAILTGRILQFGERLIVRTELVDAAHGWQIWGAQYDCLFSDVLKLQETIAREISEKLHLKLSREERKHLSKRDTESSVAYNLYAKGRFFLNQRTIKTIGQATGFFQQAIDVDARYALAYVGLADCFPLLSLYGALSPHEAYPKAAAAARKALEIDDELAEAYNSLGVVKLFYEWDWRGAEMSFREAIRLNPNYADAHQRYGMFLTAQQRFEEAVAEFEKAKNLDPLSLIIKTIGGYPFYYNRQFDEAEACFREVLAADENYSMAHFRLGLTFAQTGEFEKSIAELGKSTVLSNDRDVVAALGYVYGLQGNSEKSRAALEELEAREKNGFVSAYNRVLVFAGANDRAAALEWLEKAFAERSYWLIYLKSDPALDSLRNDARFLAIQKKIFGSERIESVDTKLPSIVLKKQAYLTEERLFKRNFWYAIVAFLLLLLMIFALMRL
jgi:TolB-like protein/Tfp pilus assembly protein PilF